MISFPGRGDGDIRRGTAQKSRKTPRKEETHVAEGYKGKIKNQGAQIVKAPSQSTKKGKSKVITGTDLRTGRGK